MSKIRLVKGDIVMNKGAYCILGKVSQVIRSTKYDIYYMNIIDSNSENDTRKDRDRFDSGPHISGVLTKIVEPNILGRF